MATRAALIRSLGVATLDQRHARIRDLLLDDNVWDAANHVIRFVSDLLRDTEYAAGSVVLDKLATAAKARVITRVDIVAWAEAQLLLHTRQLSEAERGAPEEMMLRGKIATLSQIIDEFSEGEGTQ